MKTIPAFQARALAEAAARSTSRRTVLHVCRGLILDHNRQPVELGDVRFTRGPAAATEIVLDNPAFFVRNACRFR
jgi:hypothetical protein